MMLKTLVLLVIIEATMAAKITLHQRRNLQSVSETCRMGDSCESDDECRCRDENVVCNYDMVCGLPTFMDALLRGKPCWRDFKKACTVTEDCGCGGKLVCEERECVTPKETRLVARI